MFKRSALADRFLASIRSTDIAKYRDKRLKEGKSPFTVNNEMILLSSLFNVAAKEWGFESLNNPVAKVARPKLPRGRDRRLYEGEEETLLEELPDNIKLETAMRLSEITSMEWKNVNLARRTITLEDTKNGESRTVPLSTRAVSVLKALPRNIKGRVFNISSNHVSKTFHDTCKKSGIEDLRFHDLRHEATSRLFEKGFNPMEVASITGHKTLQMLKRYTHLKAEDLAQRLG
jgi:integrase